MSNNLQEEFELYKKTQASKLPTKSIKNTIIAYTLVGIGIALCIFMVVEATSSPKTQEPEINPQAQLEQKALELDATIKQAEKDKQIAELNKQATELQLQALTLQSDDTLSN